MLQTWKRTIFDFNKAILETNDIVILKTTEILFYILHLFRYYYNFYNQYNI